MQHKSEGSAPWIWRGVIAGAGLAVAEISFTALTGFAVPVAYLALVLLADVLFGLFLGFGLALVAKMPSLGRPGVYPLSVSALTCGLTFVFFLVPTLLGMTRRGIHPWLGVLVLLVTLSGVFLTAFKLMRSFRGTKSPDLCLALSLLLVSLFLVTGNILTKTHFLSYTSSGSVVAHAAGLVGLVGCFIVLDRRTHRFRSAAPAGPRSVAITLVVLSAGAGLASCLGQENVPLDRPSGNRDASKPVGLPPVILVSIDTLRADYVSFHGHPDGRTPFLDAFARDALIFENAVSTSSWTLPAHASMLTGTLPKRHAAHHPEKQDAEGSTSGGAFFAPDIVTANPRMLAPENVTLAEILEREGYETAAIVANFAYLHRDAGFAQGFQYYDDRARIRLGYRPLVDAIVQFDPATYFHLTKPYRMAEEINGEAFRWLRDHRDEPFFLFLNYMDPHDPYYPPREFRADDGPGSTLRWDRSQTSFAGASELGTSDARHLRALYEGEIAYLDAQFGRLISKLRELDLYEESLIIATSDHGEFFGEHGLWKHGLAPYEQVHRVPLVIKYPHSRFRGVDDSPVQPLDIVPTVLAELELTAPPWLDGEALPGGSHPIITEQYYSEFMTRNHGSTLGHGHRALYDARYKLVLYTHGEMELYDLEGDPGETRNLAGERADVAAQMRVRLESYVDKIVPVVGPRHREKLDHEVLKRLRALGYVP